jgi:putative phage-type endonuclease
MSSPQTTVTAVDYALRMRAPRVINLVQGSPEWLAWRDGKAVGGSAGAETGVGGSDAGYIMGVNPYMTVIELYERKLGLHPPVEVNAAMQRGHDLEPDARVAFEMEEGLRMPAACVEHPDFPWAKASLDGRSEDGRFILEIKCPGLTTHRETLAGKIKPYYYAQCQHNLMVSGAELCYFFSYADFPDIANTHKIDVVRDEAYIVRLFEREQAFVECVKNRTPPDPKQFGVADAGALNGEVRSDPAFRTALAEMMTAKKVYDDALAQYGLRLKRIEELMQRKKQVRVVIEGTMVERVYSDGEWVTRVETMEDPIG